MAIVTKGDGGVLLALYDVMRCAGRRRVTDAAGQALDPLQVFALSRRQLVIHERTNPFVGALLRKLYE